MDDSKGAGDLNKVSKVLRIGGSAAIAGGILRLLTAPKELAMGEPGWFESADAHSSAWFLGVTLIMFGVFGFLAGIMFSARGRRAALALSKQSAQAMTEGVAAGLRSEPTARLEPKA